MCTAISCNLGCHYFGRNLDLERGFGEKIARYYGDSHLKVLNYGAKKEFTDRVSLEELYKRYRFYHSGNVFR